MKCLGLHNKPTAEVHPGHMLAGPKEEEEEEEEDRCNPFSYTSKYILLITGIIVSVLDLMNTMQVF
jgi:hypothetical protein